MSDGEFEDRDRRRLPSGTGPRLWPRGIDIRQVKIGLACRALATHDQLRRVLEKLNRSTTPESVMRLSNAPRMVRGDLKRRGRGGQRARGRQCPLFPHLPALATSGRTNLAFPCCPTHSWAFKNIPAIHASLSILRGSLPPSLRVAKALLPSWPR